MNLLRAATPGQIADCRQRGTPSTEGILATGHGFQIEHYIISLVLARGVFSRKRACQYIGNSLLSAASDRGHDVLVRRGGASRNRPAVLHRRAA